MLASVCSLVGRKKSIALLYGDSGLIFSWCTLGMSSLVRDHLNSWSIFSSRKKNRIIWKVSSLHLFWVICKERNRIVFEGAFFSPQRIKTHLNCSLFDQASCSKNTNCSFVRTLLFGHYGYGKVFAFFVRLGLLCWCFLLVRPFLVLAYTVCIFFL